jgi:hypothetical protein
MSARRQPAILVLAVSVVVATPAAADRFAPPATDTAAQQHYLHAKELFHVQQFAEAATEFAAAYELDHDAKFLVYNLAVAQRMAGACAQAIDAYREFLAAHPPADQAANAQTGIDRCQQLIAARPVAEPPLVPPATGSAAGPAVGSAVDPASAPVEPPAVEPSRSESPPNETPPTRAVRPWYRDTATVLLGASGAALAITSGVAYAFAHDAASATFSATTLGAYNDNRAAASSYQTTSVIAGIAGVGLLAAGVIRYATRSRATVAVAPTPHGAAIAWEVPW